MKLKNYITIILLLLFAVALAQCAKENVTKEEKHMQFELRNPAQNACEPLAGPNQVTKNVIQGGIYLLTYPECELKEQFLYLQDGPRFAFTDFILMIPETPGCEGLRAYLDGLSPFSYPRCDSISAASNACTPLLYN